MDDLKELYAKYGELMIGYEILQGQIQQIKSQIINNIKNAPQKPNESPSANTEITS